MPAPTDSVEIPAIPTSVVTAAGTDIHPVSQGGVTKQETNAQLATYLQTLTWPVDGGGTGLTSYAVGDIIYASGATTLAKLADVATGNALISGGVGVAPSWGKVSLTAAVSGILPLANGGSGADLSATGGANQIVRQNSAGGVFTVSALAAGDLPNTAVTPGSYGAAATVATFTVDQQGRLTAAAGVAIAIDAAAITAGTLAAARGGTGVSNAGTITNASNTTITGGGTLALGGFTATIPATLTVAGLAIANVFTLAQRANVNAPANGAFFGNDTGGGVGIRAQTATGIAIDIVSSGVGANLGAAINVARISRTSSGVPAANYGQILYWQMKTSTTADRDAANITVTWPTETEGSQKARVVHNVYDTAIREGLRIEASGSAPMIGVLGAAAVVRQTGGENLTNSVTSGGTDGTIANYTDLTVYATDAAAIRDNIYQLARILKQDHDALRLYGFLT